MNKSVSLLAGRSIKGFDHISRLWSLRRRYTHLHAWLLSLYHRVLLRLPNLPLPARHRVVRVWLRGISEPFYVRIGTTDWYVLEEIFFDAVYEPLIKRTDVEVRNIIDLGANTGFSTRLWRLKFPEAMIIAVEPDEGNMEMCRRNLLNDTTDKRLQLVRACVAATARRVALNRSGGSWRFTMREASQTEDELIEALTLPQILTGRGMDGMIDLLKCNIEGAEEELFSHCAEWIGRVRRMAVQVHYPYTSERLLEDLRRAGAPQSLYHSMDCDAGSKLLFLEQNG